MWTEVDALLEEAVSAGIVPGCAVCVRGPEAVWHTRTVGAAELRPRPRRARPGQAWDLASLTKVLATTAVAMRLVEAGRLDLDAPVAEVLSGAPEDVTARQLLQHGSGLPAWARLWEAVDDAGLAWGTRAARDHVVGVAAATPREAPPGARHLYSDLGFLVLGGVIEAIGGDRIDRLFERHVRARAGADLRWGWAGAAATEDCPVRGRVVVGEVHDLNAASMGGIAPHAGLFGSVEDVASVGAWHLRSWQAGGEGVAASTVRAFWSDRGPGSHVLGWDGVTPGGSSAGDRWPLDGVGHLAFTGCSLWIAPRQGVVVSLVSNRVHPDLEGGAAPGAPVSKRYAAFKALRPRVHTAIVEALARAGRWSD